MAEHNTTGIIGEDIALKYLENQGFSLVERNHNRKWGEIDLVVARKGVTHFVEVKSTRMAPNQTQYPDPIERIDRRKLRRLARVVQTYAKASKLSLEEGEWQVDVCVVYISESSYQASVKYVPNVLLPG